VNSTLRGKGLHAVGYLAVFDRAERKQVLAPVGLGFNGHGEHQCGPWPCLRHVAPPRSLASCCPESRPFIHPLPAHAPLDLTRRQSQRWDLSRRVLLNAF
jgi:hypothetical protein